MAHIKQSNFVMMENNFFLRAEALMLLFLEIQILFWRVKSPLARLAIIRILHQ
jgi:hypothetical protein